MTEHRLLRQWFADVKAILQQEPDADRRTYLLDGLQQARFRCYIDPPTVIDIDDERYTSQVDALARDPIKKPPYGKKRRIERGLYQSATGTVINADVNGALNHLRNVAGDSVIPQIISSGRVNRPVRIRLAFERQDLELSDRHPSYALNCDSSITVASPRR